MEGYLAIIFFVLCLLLTVFLIQTKKKLTALQNIQAKNKNVQNTFGRAVAGIEATLEQERLNSARLSRVLDTIQDGVAVMDEAGRLVYANAALWKLYAILPGERKNYLHASWLELHSPKGQEEIKTMVLPVLESKNVWLGESDVLARNGDLIRAELYISKAQAGYIGFIRNVSSRYQAELENLRLAGQLQELQKYEAVERIVRSVFHEFSNGLSAISGLSEMMIEDFRDEGVLGYAEKIQIVGQRLQEALFKARNLLSSASKSQTPAAFHPPEKKSRQQG